MENSFLSGEIDPLDGPFELLSLFFKGDSDLFGVIRW